MFLANLTRVFGTTAVAVTIALVAINLVGTPERPEVSEECRNGIPLIGDPFAAICNELR